VHAEVLAAVEDLRALQQLSLSQRLSVKGTWVQKGAPGHL